MTLGKWLLTYQSRQCALKFGKAIPLGAGNGFTLPDPSELIHNFSQDIPRIIFSIVRGASLDEHFSTITIINEST